MSRKLVRTVVQISAAAWALSALASGLFLSCAQADTISDFISIQNFKLHGRVSFKVDSSVEVEQLKADAQKKGKATDGFRLLFKGITLSDLGAPFGAEKEWTQRVEALSSRESRLAGLTLLEQADGVVVVGKWRFPGGAARLADPRMETFHYRHAEASRYVVDFWLKPGPTVAAAQAAQERKLRQERLAAAERRLKSRRDRRIANEKDRGELDDNLRFCREPWGEQREVFLPYKPLRVDFDFSKVLPQKTADQHHDYFKPEGESEEAQLFRLALKLYRGKKFALSLKTLEFLESRVHSSAIRVESLFLKANALAALEFKEPALAQLKAVTSLAPTSQAALSAAMYLALDRYGASDPLGALEQFLWLIEYHGKTAPGWVFHLGAAESLAQLRQTQRAVEEFRWVMEKAPRPEDQVLGAIRIGDLHLERREYDQALASYFLASQSFPRETARFPEFFLNRAEALYWLGQYDRAQAIYAEFMKTHPASKDGWRATYRLSEILGRAGKLQEADAQMMETVNRYPYSSGALLSRMRLMSCGSGLEPETAASAVSSFFDREASRFDPSSDFFTDRYSEYRGVAHVRALLSANDQEQAIQVALGQLEPGVVVGAPLPESKQAISRLMGYLFRKLLLKKLGAEPTDESRLAALSYYQEMAPKVALYPAGALNSDYLLKLSQAALDLGMPEWGQQLAQNYEATLRSDRRIASSDQDELDRKRLESEKAASEARALWSANAPESKIRSLLEKIAEESPYSFERELCLSILESRAGRATVALAHGVKAKMLAGEIERRDPRFQFWLSKLYRDTNQTPGALEILAELRSATQAESRRLTGIGLPAVPGPKALLVLESDLLVSQRRWGEAAKLIGEWNEEKAGPLESPMKYRQAQALMNTGAPGDLKKSREILEELTKKAPEEFWKKMAQEALEPVQTNAKEGKP